MTTDTRGTTSLVRRFYERLDAHDLDSCVEAFTQDAVYHRPGYDPIVGRAGLTRFFHHDRPVRDGRHTLEAVVANDREVGVHGEFLGHLVDGRVRELRFADFFRLSSDGRFELRRTFYFVPD